MPKAQKKPDGLEIGARCSLKMCSKHPILRLITKRCSDQPSDPMKIVIGGRNYKFWDEVVELQCPSCGSKFIATDAGRVVEQIIEGRILEKGLPLAPKMIDDPKYTWPKRTRKPKDPLRISIKDLHKIQNDRKEKKTRCCQAKECDVRVNFKTDTEIGSNIMTINAYRRIMDRIRIHYRYCENCLQIFSPLIPTVMTRSEFVSLKDQLFKETGIRIMASSPEKLIQLRNA